MCFHLKNKDDGRREGLTPSTLYFLGHPPDTLQSLQYLRLRTAFTNVSVILTFLKLTYTGRDATAPACFEEVPMHFPQHVRFFKKDPGAPQKVVQVLASRLQFGGEASVKHNRFVEKHDGTQLL